jgi:hypothetical protein
MGTERRRRALALVAALALLWSAGPARAAEDMSSEGGMGALAAISTLLYAPAKLVYATCGLIFGGAAWGLSGGDSSVLSAVVTPAVRGDYVVTPGILRGERGLEFFGRDPSYREADADAEPESGQAQAKIYAEEY